MSEKFTNESWEATPFGAALKEYENTLEADSKKDNMGVALDWVLPLNNEIMLAEMGEWSSVDEENRYSTSLIIKKDADTLKIYDVGSTSIEGEEHGFVVCRKKPHIKRIVWKDFMSAEHESTIDEALSSPQTTVVYEKVF